MVTYDQDQNIQIGITGPGQNVWVALFQAPDDTSPKVFVKPLKVSIATADGVSQNIVVNEDANGGADSIPVGDNYDIYVMSEVSHPPAGFNPGDAVPTPLNGGPVLPQDFSLAADKVNPPDIFWPPTFGCIADPDECYQDSAGTMPSLYSDVDAVRADVGSLIVRTEAGVINPLFTLEQSVTAQKPSLARRSGTGGDFPALTFDLVSGTDMQNLVIVPTAGATIANNSYIESIYAINQVSIGGSSSAAFLSLPDCVLFRNGPTGTSVSGFSYRMPNTGKHVIRIVWSASAAFGPSELYVDGVLVESADVYYPTITLRSELGGLREINFGAITNTEYLGGMVMHDGRLNAAEAAAMTTHYGNKLGLSL